MQPKSHDAVVPASTAAAAASPQAEGVDASDGSDGDYSVNTPTTGTEAAPDRGGRGRGRGRGSGRGRGGGHASARGRGGRPNPKAAEKSDEFLQNYAIQFDKPSVGKGTPSSPAVVNGTPAALLKGGRGRERWQAPTQRAPAHNLLSTPQPARSRLFTPSSGKNRSPSHRIAKSAPETIDLVSSDDGDDGDGDGGGASGANAGGASAAAGTSPPSESSVLDDSSEELQTMIRKNQVRLVCPSRTRAPTVRARTRRCALSVNLFLLGPGF